MANHFWACMSCGEHIYGYPGIVLELASEHMCEKNNDRIQQFEQCKIVLDANRTVHMPSTLM